MFASTDSGGDLRERERGVYCRTQRRVLPLDPGPDSFTTSVITGATGGNQSRVSGHIESATVQWLVMGYLEDHPLNEKFRLLGRGAKFRSPDLPYDYEWTVKGNERNKRRLLCQGNGNKITIEYGSDPVEYRFRGSGTSQVVSEVEVTDRGSILTPSTWSVSLTLLLAPYVDEVRRAFTLAYLLLSGIYLVLAVLCALTLYIVGIFGTQSSPTYSLIGVFVLGVLLFFFSFVSVRLSFDALGRRELTNRSLGVKSLLFLLGGLLAVASVTMFLPGRLLIDYGVVPVSESASLVVNAVYTVHALFLAGLFVHAVWFLIRRERFSSLQKVLNRGISSRILVSIVVYVTFDFLLLWIFAVSWRPPDSTTVAVWTLASIVSVVDYILIPIIRDRY